MHASSVFGTDDVTAYPVSLAKFCFEKGRKNVIKVVVEVVVQPPAT